MSLSPSALFSTALVAGPAMNHAMEGAPAPKRASVGSRHTANEPEEDCNSPCGPLPALCAFAEVRPAPDQDAASKARPFASIWHSAIETGEPESAVTDPNPFSILGSQQAASPESVLAGNDVPALTRLALAGIARGSGIPDINLPADDRPAGSIATLSQVRQPLQAELARQVLGAMTVSVADADGSETAAKSMAAGFDTGEAVPQGADGSAQRQTKTEERGSRSGEPSLAHFASVASSHLDTISKFLVSGKGQEPRDKRAEPPQIAPLSGGADAAVVLDAAVTATVVEHGAVNAVPTTDPTVKTTSTGAAAPPQRHTSSMFHGSTSTFGVDAPAAPEGLDAAARSEIAFEAEIRATGKSAAESSPVKGQPGAQAVFAATANDRGAVATRTAEPSGQAPFPEALSGRNGEAAVESVARLGRSSGAAGADTGSSRDQNEGADIGRGARQGVLPVSHDPAPTSLKVPVEAARAGKEVATPAAHLEALLSDTPIANEQPARSLTMKIHSEEHGSANVVLTDRAGQVHVTVRAADPSLTQSLRSELSSLAGGLEQQGFAVKVWHPSAGSSMDGDRREHSAESAGPDDAGSQPQQDQHPGDAGRRNRRQPQWVEELD